MEALTITPTILTLTNLLARKVTQVKTNKQQCQRLYDRIQVVTDSINSLNQTKLETQYKTGLRALHTCVEECLAFISQFAEDKWYQKALKSGIQEKKFLKLTQNLGEAANLLQLGLAAEQIVNNAHDKHDQENDRRALQVQQDTIIELQQAAQRDLSDLKMDERQHHDVLMLQMGSMRAQLANLSLSRTTEVEQPPLDQHLIIQPHDILFQDVILENTFGIVYRGTWQGETVAIKRLQSLDPGSRDTFHLSYQQQMLLEQIDQMLLLAE